MFTSWDQVESWIRDNNFAHWIIYKTRPEDGEKGNNIIADSKFYTGDEADKIAMTKKYLLLNGGRGYGVGFATPNSTVGGVVCEIRLEDETAQPVNGAQGLGGYQSIGELRDQITREIKAQIKAEQYEAEKKQFEKEKAEFEEEKKTAIGALVHYFAPIGQMLLEKRMMPRVAGVDAEEPVHAAPIVTERHETPEDAPEEPQDEPFTDEEAEQLMQLMVRFKAVEPDYLKLIQSVVEMAERNDPTYTMAKGFLVK